MNGGYYYIIFLFISAEGSGMFSQIVFQFALLLLNVYFLNVRLCKISLNSGISLTRRTFYFCFSAKGTQRQGKLEASNASHSCYLDPGLSERKARVANSSPCFLSPSQPLCHSCLMGQAVLVPALGFFLPLWTFHLWRRNSSISFLANLH